MSHLYEASIQVVSAAGPTPIATILAGSVQCEIREVCISFVTSVAAATQQFGRPAALGTGGSSTGNLVQAADGSDAAGQATLVASFVTAQPTAPTVAMRIGKTQNINSGYLWVWNPAELVVPAAGQWVIWLLSGQGTFDVFVKVAE